MEAVVGSCARTYVEFYANISDLIPMKDTKSEVWLNFWIYVTVLAKTCIVCISTEFNFIAAAYRHTQYLSISGVSSVKC